MKRLPLALALVAVLLVATAPAALGKTTRTTFTGYELLTGVTEPGAVSLVGTTYSLLGMEDTANLYYMPGSVLVALQTSVVNYRIDVVTGEGEIWGTSKQYAPPPAEPELVYTCVWHGTFVPGTVSFTGPGWTGKSVCHGTGAMAGWQTRSDLVPASDFPGTLFSGITFFPGDRA